MKLKTVSATYGRKVNLGDYNSQHVEITLWADLEDGDDPGGATTGLREMARNHAMKELSRTNETMKAKVENLFLGLPIATREQLEEA